ncbi:MAG: tRNA lysidine(34) synthetase TilS [Spirochaetes bacterium]|nr:tRNA lysidine(34) synthetase TilS [Spirochaetota bacterium]
MILTEKLLKIVEETVSRFSLINPGDRILVALSGGPDSVAMTRLLLLLREKIQIHIACAHLNHGFRDKESDNDEQFSKEFSNNLNLSFFSKKVNLPGIIKKSYGSAQMVAREVRYAFLEDIAQKNDYNKIAIAHTKDDRIETLLLKLFSGTSPAGLSSIPFSREQYIRPLAHIFKKQLKSILKDMKQPYVIDSSNQSNGYKRNMLRNRVMPVLSKSFPGYEERLLSLINIINDENKYWKEEFKRNKKYGLNKYSLGVSFELVKLSDAPLVMIKRIISEVSFNISGLGRGPGSSFYKKIESFLSSPKNGRIWFKNRFIIITELDGRLCIEKYKKTSIETGFSQSCGEGLFDFPWGKIEISRESPPFTDRNFFQEQAKKGIFWFNLSNVSLPFNIRNRKNGDRIRISKTGSKKVKDLLIDNKIPLRERLNCTIVESAGSVIASILPDSPAKSRLAEHSLIMDNKEAIVLKIRKSG